MAATQITEHEIQEFISDLALLDGHGPGVEDATRVQLITALESLKAAAAAAQARISVTFAESQRATQRAAGMPRDKIGAGIAAQVALARRESPSLGSRHLGLAMALVTEMPHTLAALTTGELSEWRATLITRATATLTEEHRRDIDSRLAGRLAGLSDKQVAAAANALAYELDPRTVVERHAYARSQRRVSIRPAPDTMAYLTALLPAHEAVAVYAALTHTAATARSDGDPRSTDQVKADTLVERITGQDHAHHVPIDIGLVMTDTTLTDTDHTPAILQGYGPIPAALARDILRDTIRPAGSSHRRTPSSDGSIDGHHQADAYRARRVSERADQRDPGAPHTQDCSPKDHDQARPPEPHSGGCPTEGHDQSSIDQRVNAHADTADRATEIDRTLNATRPEAELDSAPSGLVIDVFQRPAPRSKQQHDQPPSDQQRSAPHDAEQWTGNDIHTAAVWIRRLYTDKRTGVITSADRKRRYFPEHLRQLVIARDQWCRTPYCSAPIKHIDHAQRHADGGPTTPDNAQGLCERCNHTKETPGWTTTTNHLPDDITVILTTTPTGTRHHSTAPPWHAA
ncbi:MAG: DUF222 domain-containing protein [Actinomycetales bacterium]|nr:DUF222 domain-containing protein [Actinomycetales bacterium]